MLTYIGTQVYQSTCDITHAMFPVSNFFSENLTSTGRCTYEWHSHPCFHDVKNKLSKHLSVVYFLSVHFICKIRVICKDNFQVIRGERDIF